MVRALIGVLVLGLAVVCGFILWPASYERQDVIIPTPDGDLAAALILPDPGVPLKGCVVFIHGDGPLAAEAYGYYDPFWSAMSEAGYCALSWDKPGVGDSAGQWLDDSMASRAARVETAIAWLREETGLKNTQIHLISFSQGGWVAPKVMAQNPCLASWISVSSAINWQAQGQYMGRVRREEAGLSPAQIEAELDEGARLNARMTEGLSYESYVEEALARGETLDELPSRAQWGFWLRNIKSDSRADLHALTQPVLALFGDHDANVDITDTQAVFDDILADRDAPYQALVFENAEHGLLRSQTLVAYRNDWQAIKTLIALRVQGRSAFAEGVFPAILDWLDAQTEPTASSQCSM
ncbi:alpha/beta hydrolase family protein [Woodsholea maritima]|uniref:alpha/beta hydrolase family protein n=1 Tax=Woodsholea maritima TaxID=240237 RepID=UPI00037848AB|nr:alpha/beta hydrolase [Woodsholea maritima]